MLYLCINKNDKAMNKIYSIRTCVDESSKLHYFEFFRNSDGLVIYMSTVFDFIHTYALGYTNALGAELIIL